MDLQVENKEMVRGNNGRFDYKVVTVQSASNRETTYRVDTTNRRCSCPAWKFSKPRNGVRPPCKHLRALAA